MSLSQLAEQSQRETERAAAKVTADRLAETADKHLAELTERLNAPEPLSIRLVEILQGEHPVKVTGSFRTQDFRQTRHVISRFQVDDLVIVHLNQAWCLETACPMCGGTSYTNLGLYGRDFDSHVQTIGKAAASPSRCWDCDCSLPHDCRSCGRKVTTRDHLPMP